METTIEWLVEFWQRSLFGKAACVAAGLLLLSLLRIWYIRRCRQRMVAYGEFLHETFTQCGKPVPAMFMAYLRRDADRYNRSRRGWPFRHLWQEADDSFLQERFLSFGKEERQPAALPHPVSDACRTADGGKTPEIR